MSAVHTYRQAITTRFIAPTDHRGQRVKVQCDAGSLIVPWDDAHNIQENHRRAVLRWCEHMERKGHPEWSRATWIGGTTHDASGSMVWTDATQEIEAACTLAAEAARLRAEGAENP